MSMIHLYIIPVYLSSLLALFLWKKYGYFAFFENVFYNASNMVYFIINMNATKYKFLYLPRAFLSGVICLLHNIINLEHRVVLSVQRTLHNALLAWTLLILLFFSALFLIGCFILVLMYQAPLLSLCI